MELSCDGVLAAVAQSLLRAWELQRCQYKRASEVQYGRRCPRQMIEKEEVRRSGCKCDVKIHGFNDRLLRFDVVEFDNGRQQNSQKMAPLLRYNFAGVNFSRLSISSPPASVNEQHGAHDDDMETTQSSYAYTTENVIETLNAIVLWDNQRQKTGLSSWLNGITNALEECLSLGAYEVEDENDPHV